MIIVFAALAKRDLVNVARWVGQDYPTRGTAFVAKLQTKCNSLIRFPRRHPLVAHYSGEPVRKFPCKPYIVFYMVHHNRLEILRIVHGATDWQSLFALEE